jgi:hypothetical protein
MILTSDVGILFFYFFIQKVISSDFNSKIWGYLYPFQNDQKEGSLHF